MLEDYWGIFIKDWTIFSEHNSNIIAEYKKQT
jgi:hypothetical protein